MNYHVKLKSISIILFFVMGMNIAYVDYLLFFKKSQLPVPSVVTEVPSAISPIAQSKEVEVPEVDFAQVAQTATASLTQQVADLEKQIVAGKTVVTTTKSTTTAKELYIPLGSGSTQAQSWSELPGREAYIAPSNYGKITQMYFEASLRIPTGNGRVYARIKNVTDNVGLFESEVTTESSTGVLLSSVKVPIPSQTKLYRVEMYSTLGAEAVVDNARIKLFVQ